MAEKKWHSFRDLSKVDYGATVDDDKLDKDDQCLQKGSFLRIADALERLASGKSQLETLKELEGQKKIVSDLSNSYTTIRLERERLWRRVSALRGVITKLKGKLGPK